jgi:cytochrome oxidase Cu insertion factor (SCO1/SenC/PrrC family)
MLKRILIGLAILLLAFGVFVWTQLYLYPKAQIAATSHQPAPDFTLTDARGNPFSLSSQKGHKVVLYFYRGYW